LEEQDPRPSPLRVEDLALGQVFEVGSRAITREEIISFAAQYDPQPFHVDEAAGEASLFKGLVASGLQTFAITVRLLMESPLYLTGGLIITRGEIQWRRPVRPGNVLHLRIEVIDVAIDSEKDRAIVGLNIQTLNQNEEVVLIFAPRLLTERRTIKRD
jgi:acyl dehydratase